MKRVRLSEALVGTLWAKLAREEGHMRRFPPAMTKNQGEAIAKARREKEIRNER